MQYVLETAVAAAQDDTFWTKRHKEERVIPRYIQLALHRDKDLWKVVKHSQDMVSLTNHFMDNSTANILRQHELLDKTTQDLLDQESSVEGSSNETALAAIHDKQQSQWKKQKDSTVNDVDLSRLLKKVHPVYALSHDAIVFLSALIRELLLAIMKDVQQNNRNTRELAPGDIQKIVTDIMPPSTTLGKRAAGGGEEALQRYELKSTAGRRTRIRVRRQKATVTVSQRSVVLSRQKPMGKFLQKLCLKWRIDRSSFVFLYNGQVIKDTDTPRKLCMSADNETPHDIFALPVKWWNYKRRDDARRGLLSSTAYQDDAVRNFKKVKSKCGDTRLPPVSMKHIRPVRKLLPVAYKRPPRAQSKIKADIAKGSKLRHPRRSSGKSGLKRPQIVSKHKKNGAKRLISSPKVGHKVDLTRLKTIKTPTSRTLSQGASLNTSSETPAKVKEQEAKRASAQREKDRKQRELKKQQRRKHEAEQKAAALKIQSRFRGLKGRRRSVEIRVDSMETEFRKKRASSQARLLAQSQRAIKQLDRVHRDYGAMLNGVKSLQKLIREDRGQIGGSKQLAIVQNGQSAIMNDLIRGSQESVEGIVGLIREWDDENSMHKQTMQRMRGISQLAGNRKKAPFEEEGKGNQKANFTTEVAVESESAASLGDTAEVQL